MTAEKSQSIRSRREGRRGVMLQVHVVNRRTESASQHRARDISSCGLRIDQAKPLSCGDDVLVSVGAIEMERATVMWVDRGFAGLSFDEPIDRDAAFAKAAVKRSPVPMQSMEAKSTSPTAGWLPSLDDPYKK